MLLIPNARWDRTIIVQWGEFCIWCFKRCRVSFPSADRWCVPEQHYAKRNLSNSNIKSSAGTLLSKEIPVVRLNKRVCVCRQVWVGKGHETKVSPSGGWLQWTYLYVHTILSYNHTAPWACSRLLPVKWEVFMGFAKHFAAILIVRDTT